MERPRISFADNGGYLQFTQYGESVTLLTAREFTSFGKAILPVYFLEDGIWTVSMFSILGEANGIMLQPVDGNSAAAPAGSGNSSSVLYTVIMSDGTEVQLAVSLDSNGTLKIGAPESLLRGQGLKKVVLAALYIAGNQFNVNASNIHKIEITGRQPSMLSDIRQ